VIISFNRRSFAIAAPLLAFALSAGCGSGSAVQKPEKTYTVQEAKDQFQKDLERNLAGIDADPKLSAAQKEANKKMMKETFARRVENWKE